MKLRCLLVIGDSRSMEEVEDNSVTLVVTSPPYWNLDVFSKEGDIGSQFDLSRLDSKEKFFGEISKVWKECYRVLRPGGHLVCEFEDYPVGSRLYGYPREILLAGDMNDSIESSGLYLISRWIWKKFESGVAISKFPYTLYGSEPRAIANWAYCFVYKKKARLEETRTLDFTRREWKVWSDGIWEIPASREAGAEEKYGISGGAVFPEELVERFIRLYTRRGQTVLDPFLGTGTTMKVALKLGRHAIGYECLEKFLSVIVARTGWGLQPLDKEIEWKLVKRV